MSVFLICTRTSKAKVALDKKIAQKLSDMDITVKCCPCDKEKNKKRMILPDPAPATAPSSKKKFQKTPAPISPGGLEVLADIALSVGLALLPLGAGALLARLAARAVAPLAYQALGVFSRWAGSLTMGSSATGTACAAAATGVAGVITPSLGGYPSE